VPQRELPPCEQKRRNQAKRIPPRPNLKLTLKFTEHNLNAARTVGSLAFCGLCALIAQPTLADPSPAPVTATLHVSDIKQPIYGFGGTLTYAADSLASFPNRDTVYKLLYQDLNLDILRLRNYDGYAGQQQAFDSITKEFADGAIRDSVPALRNGKKPVRLMFTSWSPPEYLKSNDLTSGTSNGTATGLLNATLKRGPDGKYEYGAFADWWLQSIQQFKTLCGQYPNYIALQNELDFSVPYPACHFLPTQGISSDGYPMAGYDQALAAVYSRLSSALGTSAPKILGPETFTINTNPGGVNHVTEYVDPKTAIGKKELTELFGISFHLYGTGASGSDLPRFHSDLASLPAAYQTGSIYKPLFETEYLKGDTMTALAGMIHDTLTDGNVSAYLTWLIARSTKSPGLALVYFNPDNGLVETRQLFYAVKAYSAFVGEGWHRIGADCTDPAVEISAFISPNSRRLVSVLINPTTTPHQITVSPDGTLDTKDASAVYASSEGEAGERWQSLGPLQAGNTLTMPAKSVATIVFTRP
jgi:O-glycosyl hydrolase